MKIHISQELLSLKDSNIILQGFKYILGRLPTGVTDPFVALNRATYNRSYKVMFTSGELQASTYFDNDTCKICLTDVPPNQLNNPYKYLYLTFRSPITHGNQVLLGYVIELEDGDLSTANKIFLNFPLLHDCEFKFLNNENDSKLTTPINPDKVNTFKGRRETVINTIKTSVDINNLAPFSSTINSNGLIL